MDYAFATNAPDIRHIDIGDTKNNAVHDYNEKLPSELEVYGYSVEPGTCGGDDEGAILIRTTLVDTLSAALQLNQDDDKVHLTRASAVELDHNYKALVNENMALRRQRDDAVNATHSRWQTDYIWSITTRPKGDDLRSGASTPKTSDDHDSGNESPPCKLALSPLALAARCGERSPSGSLPPTQGNGWAAAEMKENERALREEVASLQQGILDREARSAQMEAMFREAIEQRNVYIEEVRVAFEAMQQRLTTLQGEHYETMQAHTTLAMEVMQLRDINNHIKGQEEQRIRIEKSQELRLQGQEQKIKELQGIITKQHEDKCMEHEHQEYDLATSKVAAWTKENERLRALLDSKEADIKERVRELNKAQSQMAALNKRIKADQERYRRVQEEMRAMRNEMLAMQREGDDNERRRRERKGYHLTVMNKMKIKFKGCNGQKWLHEYCRMGKYKQPRVSTEYIGASGKRKVGKATLRMAKSSGHHVWQCTIVLGEGKSELEHVEQSTHKNDAIAQCYNNFAAEIANGNM